MNTEIPVHLLGRCLTSLFLLIRLPIHNTCSFSILFFCLLPLIVIPGNCIIFY